jgi:hypothetical protein
MGGAATRPTTAVEADELPPGAVTASQPGPTEAR